MKNKKLSPRSGPVGLAGLLLTAFLLTACQTVPPPPPPAEPPPEFQQEAPQPPPPPPPAPKVFLQVTGNKVNLRKGPGTDQGLLPIKAKRGERFEVVGQQGEWFEILLADGTHAFLSSKFARQEEPCPPDELSPTVLNGPQLSFSQTGPHGVVTLKISVDATGGVKDVKVSGNSTGDPGLETQAVSEVRAMKFKPLIRKCKPTPFTYVFNRTF